MQTHGNPEPMRYRLSFTLPAGISNPSLAGRVWSDDQTAAVIVNGTAILTIASGWATYPQGAFTQEFATSDASLFHCGTNVLEFDTVNLGGVGGITFSANLSYDGGVAGSCATLENLLIYVDELKPGKSFSAQVKAILTKRDAGDLAGACVALQDFVNHVNAQSGKSLTATQVAEILAAAAQIKQSLGC